MRSGNDLDLKNAPSAAALVETQQHTPQPVQPEPEPDLDQDHENSGRRHIFFQRSESTLCLGCPPPDPFGTSEPIPLAEQPQLLQPNARREDLFGSPKQPLSTTTSNPLAVLPTKLGLVSRTSDEYISNPLTRSVSPTTVAATCDTAS